MSIDLSPAPGAAPLRRMIASQAIIETRLLVRNAEQLVLALVIPLLNLVVGSDSSGIVDLGPGRPIDTLAPGVLALAVMSTAFTSLAIATGFERRYGVLKRLGASPLPRLGLLAGKGGAVAVVQCVQLIVLGVAALLLGWHPGGGPAAFGWLLILTVLGTAAFGSLALLIAGTLRAEATLAVANLVYVVLLVGGAVLVPLSRYPEAAQPLVRLLPSGALGEGLRDAFTGEGPGVMTVLVLLVWACVAGAAASRTFRWE